MPTSNTQLIDHEGQAVMDGFISAGADPETAYNATQGVRKMSGEQVIAEIREFRSEFQALTVDVQTLKVDVQTLTAELRAHEAASAAEHAAMDDRINASSTQLDIVSWAVIATFAMVTLLTATGMLRMLGLGPRRRKSKKREKPRVADQKGSEPTS